MRHIDTVLAAEGTGGAAACIHSKAANQPLGTPKFFRCTAKFLVEIFTVKAFTIHIKCRNLAGTFKILRYTRSFIVEVFGWICCSEHSL